MFVCPRGAESDRGANTTCYGNPTGIHGCDNHPGSMPLSTYFPNAFFSSGSISPLAAMGSRISVSP